MQIWVKYQKGKRKGYNIRKDKNRKYHAYEGNFNLTGFPFDTLKEARDYIKKYVSEY